MQTSQDGRVNDTGFVLLTNEEDMSPWYSGKAHAVNPSVNGAWEQFLTVTTHNHMIRRRTLALRSLMIARERCDGGDQLFDYGKMSEAVAGVRSLQCTRSGFHAGRRRLVSIA